MVSQFLTQLDLIVKVQEQVEMEVVEELLIKMQEETAMVISCAKAKEFPSSCAKGFRESRGYSVSKEI